MGSTFGFIERIAPHARCALDAGVHKMSGIKTLSLVKGKEHFCFRYEAGQEASVLDALIEMVNRRDMAFDWFDAAVLSHQLGQHLSKELKAYLPKKAA
jgi:hypothetical protein